jgi:thioredoxin reductase (NADPH)
MSNIYDIIIIGGGPSGLTAGIYSSRAGYKTLLIEKLVPGGQMILTDLIENYPGFPDGVTGFELQERFTKQAEKFGVEIISDDIIKIEKNNDEFTAHSHVNEYKAISVILASGSSYKKLDVPGEKEYSAKGVSYCGTCDAPFFKGKNVAVIGGGDTALTEALFISKFAKSVKILHRKERFRAISDLIKKTTKEPNIEFVFNTIVNEIKGENFVKSIITKNSLTNKIEEIPVDGVFIFIGTIPNTNFVPENILDEYKFIITDSKMKTQIDGLFACGDARSDAFRQIICASAEGATASENAGIYVDKIKGNSYK